MEFVPSEASPARVAHAFATFLTASRAADVQRAFESLLTSLGVGSAPPPLARLAEMLEPMLPFRSRSLLHMLVAWRAAHARPGPPNSERSSPVPPTKLRVVLIGAGPIGLRTAIELAAIGAEVTVLERRDSFNRLQIVRLWDYVEQDLIEMGVKIIDPSIFTGADCRRAQSAPAGLDPPTSGSSHPCHALLLRCLLTPVFAGSTPCVAVCQLQHSMMKIALLLGVHIAFGSRVDSVGDLIAAQRAARASSNGSVDMLVDASGARCPLLSTLGFSRVLALRSPCALCIVISLHHGKTAEENELRETSWASQYHPQAFSALQASASVTLENFVYYRSTGAFSPHGATHYFLMTTDVRPLALRCFQRSTLLHRTSSAPVRPSHFPCALTPHHWCARLSTLTGGLPHLIRCSTRRLSRRPGRPHPK